MVWMILCAGRGRAVDVPRLHLGQPHYSITSAVSHILNRVFHQQKQQVLQPKVVCLVHLTVTVCRP